MPKPHRPPLPELCLTPAVPAPNPTGDDDADVEAYEREHVHAVYDAIAPHFALTRHKPWPKVTKFLHSLERGALVADIGCGNGKYNQVAHEAGMTLIGVDRCGAFADSFGHTAGHAAAGDALSIPLRSGAFDAAMSIAVTHHVATRSRRVAAWRELVRVLRVGGLALCFVWARERPDDASPQDKARKAKRMLNRTFQHPDMLVPWHLRQKVPSAKDPKVLGDPVAVYRRYYHIYSKGELELELEQVEDAKVVESYFAHQNWCAIVQKIDKSYKSEKQS